MSGVLRVLHRLGPENATSLGGPLGSACSYWVGKARTWLVGLCY